MTKVDIISGFLGAGKTTLISKLLKEALEGEQVVHITIPQNQLEQYENQEPKTLNFQKEYEEASKPVTVKDWKLIFVFDKANVIVKGQIAKNLYMDLEKVGSEINLEMHIDKVNHLLYETKLALIVDSYEIL